MTSQFDHVAVASLQMEVAPQSHDGAEAEAEAARMPEAATELQEPLSLRACSCSSSSSSSFASSPSSSTNTVAGGMLVVRKNAESAVAAEPLSSRDTNHTTGAAQKPTRLSLMVTLKTQSGARPDGDVLQSFVSHHPTAACHGPIPAQLDTTPEVNKPTTTVSTTDSSSRTVAGASMMPTPPFEPVSFTVTESAQAPLYQNHMSELFQGMYARDPNPKRGATKAYREIETPVPLRKRKRVPQVLQTDCKRRKQDDADDTLRSPVSMLTLTPPRTTPTAQPPSFALDTRWAQQDHAAPIRDIEGDREYVAEMLHVLGEQGNVKGSTTHKVSSRRIRDLLSISEYPTIDEAKFCSTHEAQAELMPNKFFNGIIVTQGQQSLPLQSPEHFLDEYYEDDQQVWIQDSSMRAGNKSAVRAVRMDQIKERFSANNSTEPWNLLELATHHEDGFRPPFLNHEDCRLLTKLKIPDAADEARRKTYAVGFKEVEKWALLAQAGALTEPHQDSHGYSTYITINTGRVGFGWLSNPTEEERASWRKTPSRFRAGKWRYIILKPGQTVYFPSGTVHMVFRLPSVGHTLAFGGHVLRCSTIVHWVKVLLEEHSNPNVTNEDLTDSSTGYLARVERFILHAKKTGRGIEKWGGLESIEEFLKLKLEFTRKRKPKNR